MLFGSIKHQNFICIRSCMETTRFQHLSNINIILILGINPLFHFLNHLRRPKRVVAYVFIRWQFHILSKLSISIVTLFVVAPKLFEAILILASWPIFLNKDSRGLSAIWILKVMKDLEVTSLWYCTIIWKISFSVILISQTELRSVLINEEWNFLIIMPTNRLWARRILNSHIYNLTCS